MGKGLRAYALEWNLRLQGINHFDTRPAMARIEKSIEVNAPLRAVYDQWTHFEEFPRFMEGIVRVRQVDDTHLRWHARIGGKDKEWDAEIIEQVPDRRCCARRCARADVAARAGRPRALSRFHREP